MTQIMAYISNGIAFIIAFLHLNAGQAHFTARLTPGLAADVHTFETNLFAATNDFFGLARFETFSTAFGIYDIVSALFLLRKHYRKTALMFAVLDFSFTLYGQLYAGGAIGEVSVLLALAVVGFLLAPRRF